MFTDLMTSRTDDVQLKTTTSTTIVATVLTTRTKDPCLDLDDCFYPDFDDENDGPTWESITLIAIVTIIIIVALSCGYAAIHKYWLLPRQRAPTPPAPRVELASRQVALRVTLSRTRPPVNNSSTTTRFWTPRVTASEPVASQHDESMAHVNLSPRVGDTPFNVAIDMTSPPPYCDQPPIYEEIYSISGDICGSVTSSVPLCDAISVPNDVSISAPTGA